MTTQSRQSDPGIPWYRQLEKHHWRTLLATWIGWALDAFDFLAISFVLTQIAAEFDIGLGQASVLVSAAFLTRWLGGAVLGGVADRIGRRTAMIIGILLYSGATFLCGLSWDFWSLLAFRLVVGFGMAGEYSAGTAMLYESWPPAQRRKASGFLMSAYAAGSLSLALVYPLIVPTLGWRWLFFVGILPALLAFYVRRHIEDPEEFAQAKARGRTGGLPFARLLGRKWGPVFLLLIVVEFALFVTSFVALTLLPTWLKSTGYATGTVSSLMTLASVGYLLGCILSGFLADRVGYRAALPLMLVISGIVIVPAFFVQLAVAPLGVLLFLVGMMNLGSAGLIIGYVAQHFTTDVRATALGATHNIGALGGAVAPLMATGLSQSWGLGPAMAVTMLVWTLVIVVFVGANIPMRALQRTGGPTAGKAPSSESPSDHREPAPDSTS